MNFQKRELIPIVLLSIFTFGIYLFYWVYKTRQELNKMGGDVPHPILVLIPFLNFYFWYKYAQAYSAIVKHNSKDTDVLLYFVIGAFLPIIAVIVFQDGYNNYN